MPKQLWQVGQSQSVNCEGCLHVCFLFYMILANLWVCVKPPLNPLISLLHFASLLQQSHYILQNSDINFFEYSIIITNRK